MTVLATSPLATDLISAGHRALHYAEIDSTMSEASRQAASGVSGPLWIIADIQQTGRGRHGRHWVSPQGNLYATMLLTSRIPARNAAEIGFVAGLALHDAVSKSAGFSLPDLSLKWPNDLLLARAKCGGLLLEGTSSGKQFSLAIGFGVNIHHAPQDTPYNATCLAEHLHLPSRDGLMLELANSFAERLSLWHKTRETGNGFATIRDEWRKRAAFLGETVTLRLPSGPISGIFEDVDGDCRLVLVTAESRHIIDAGDLFFGDAGA